MSEAPVQAPPELGQAVEIAEGILWLRLPLPLRLDHVNVYLIEDEGGFAVIDTGWPDDTTQAIWRHVLKHVVGHGRITRVIATHHHPDHIGNAGWLARAAHAPLLMSEAEYLLAAARSAGFFDQARTSYLDFYTQRGLSAELAAHLLDTVAQYGRIVTPLPPHFAVLQAGETLPIGGRDFTVLLGGGHSNQQVMFYCAAQRVFLSIDQILPDITPHIGVWPVEPEASPLDTFFTSLAAVAAEVDEAALVLPGHKLPFRGPQRRIAEITAHHEGVCDRIAAIVAAGPCTIAAIADAIFDRPLDDRNRGLAFSETLAHVNFMRRQGRLRQTDDGAGNLFVSTNA
ncbi:MAG TPA: MBL fold metallo-hydrolase [Acidisoma sp.]|jgi:glyoxylase-like metal-dependent hydrolase (beta-lactamase superfamily II)|nr:MBL fold metallo-hydrolase [Acidisoma sp.]